MYWTLFRWYKELIENELLFHTNIEDCKPFDWNKMIKVDDEEIYNASILSINHEKL